MSIHGRDAVHQEVSSPTSREVFRKPDWVLDFDQGDFLPIWGQHRYVCPIRQGCNETMLRIKSNCVRKRDGQGHNRIVAGDDKGF